jgi:hypothetical protein
MDKTDDDDGQRMIVRAHTWAKNNGNKTIFLWTTSSTHFDMLYLLCGAIAWKTCPHGPSVTWDDLWRGPLITNDNLSPKDHPLSGYPEMWILRYPAHRYRTVPLPGFEPTTLWLRVRRPNHSATTIHCLGWLIPMDHLSPGTTCPGTTHHLWQFVPKDHPLPGQLAPKECVSRFVPETTHHLDNLSPRITHCLGWLVHKDHPLQEWLVLGTTHHLWQRVPKDHPLPGITCPQGQSVTCDMSCPVDHSTCPQEPSIPIPWDDLSPRTICHLGQLVPGTSHYLWQLVPKDHPFPSFDPYDNRPFNCMDTFTPCIF